jgi:LysM repeat protein
MVNYVMTENSGTPAHDPHKEAVEGFGDWSDDDAFDAGDKGVTRGGPRGTFLTDLGDTLRGAGLSVTEHDGWQQRSRGSGGYNGGPIGIIVHHTASPPHNDGRNDVDFIVTNKASAPISNLYLDRTGKWWVLAAGATNTNGKGGPWGPIPIDGANARVIGIEAANNGVGEPWPDEMQDAYVKGVAALADRYGIDSNNVLSHHEWAPTRKMDPAGPSRFGSINRSNTWDMNMFRAAVNAARNQPGTVHVADVKAVTADVDTYVVQPGDAWWSIARKTMGDPGKTWQALADANGGVDRVLLAGAVLTIPKTA